MFQALCSFPGISQIFSAHYALAHGITLGVVSIEIAPQTTFPQDRGDVVFTEDGAAVLTLTDCKLDSGSFEANDAGQIWRLNILDRRWRWAFPIISLRANIRDDAHSIIEETELAPTDIAKACLRAMGESSYVLEELPNDSRPTVDWDCVNAAQALAQLCDELGCRVVLSSDNAVHLCTTGFGADLPQTPDVLSYSVMPDPLERPDSIVIVGAPYRFQNDFPLQAVGKDVDGSVRPIEELSYRPDPNAADGGWSQQPMPWVVNFPPGVSPLVRQLAEETVFKWYRIDLSGAGNSGAAFDALGRTIAQLPDGGLQDFSLSDLRQILPIHDVQVERYFDVATDASGNSITVLRDRPAMVYGLWFDETRLDNGRYGNSQAAFAFIQDENGIASDETRTPFDGQDATLTYGLDPTNTAAIVWRPFTIDRKRGIVMFSEPIYRALRDPNDSSGVETLGPGAAQLVLRTSFGIKDPVTHQWLRFKQEFPLTPPAGQRNEGPANSPPVKRYVVRNEIARRTRFYRTPAGNIDDAKTLDNLATNDAWDPNSALMPELERQFAALAADYEHVVALQSASYVGLKQIALDGAIGLVIWDIHARGSTTTAFRNHDAHPDLVSYRERRFIEKCKRALTPDF